MEYPISLFDENTRVDYSKGVGPIVEKLHDYLGSIQNPFEQVEASLGFAIPSLIPISMRSIIQSYLCDVIATL